MANAIPVLPRAVSLSLRPMPRAALRMGGQMLLDSILRRHPSLLRRLGIYRDRTVLIDPTDLPFLFRLVLGPGRPHLDVLPRRKAIAGQATIRGPLAALLGLVHGAYDGDALFFSRDLTIEGDTEAVVALRNAIDDAELDLVAEMARLLGPFGHFAERSARRILPAAERATGVALSRANGLRP